MAELYNLNLVKIPQVRNALEWLMNCPNGMITSAMESLVIFLFISGSKLDADINDEVWMNRLIEFWEKKANLIAHNQGRPLCLLRDVIELRQNKWTPLRQPHWIPPTIDLPTFRFEPESLIRLFQSDRMVRFIIMIYQIKNANTNVNAFDGVYFRNFYGSSKAKHPLYPGSKGFLKKPWSMLFVTGIVTGIQNF